MKHYSTKNKEWRAIILAALLEARQRMPAFKGSFDTVYPYGKQVPKDVYWFPFDHDGILGIGMWSTKQHKLVEVYFLQGSIYL